MKTFLNEYALVQLEERCKNYQVVVFFRNTHNTEILSFNSYNAAYNKFNEVCKLVM